MAAQITLTFPSSSKADVERFVLPILKKALLIETVNERCMSELFPGTELIVEDIKT